jgi:hypothetical protein
MLALKRPHGGRGKNIHVRPRRLEERFYNLYHNATSDSIRNLIEQQTGYYLQAVRTVDCSLFA